MFGLHVALLAQIYPKTDWRHWPAGVRSTGLAAHVASVTNCLNSIKTSDGCGPLVAGRLNATADWCGRMERWTDGSLAIRDALQGTTIDVIIIPAADDVFWSETTTLGGFVGDVLESIALRGGFRINAFIIRQPDGSASDTYGGSYTKLLEDWAPRADMVANWWTDVPARRALGVHYLAPFYRLDLTLITRMIPSEEYGATRNQLNFSFMDPFGLDTWIAIAVTVLLIGLIERYIEGHYDQRHFGATEIAERVAKARAARNLDNEPIGSISIRATWKAERQDDRDGRGVLEVVIQRASNLLAADSSGTSDPYAIIHMGGERKRTPTIRKTLNPVWDTAFEFACAARTQAVALRVDVYDYDGVLSKPDELGGATIELRELLAEEQTAEVSAPLHMRPLSVMELRKRLGPFTARVCRGASEPNPLLTSSRAAEHPAPSDMCVRPLRPRRVSLRGAPRRVGLRLVHCLVGIHRGRRVPGEI